MEHASKMHVFLLHAGTMLTVALTDGLTRRIALATIVMILTGHGHATALELALLRAAIQTKTS
jgi:hypothetical protein